MTGQESLNQPFVIHFSKDNIINRFTCNTVEEEDNDDDDDVPSGE